MTLIIDADQHLHEPLDMWREYSDPSQRHLALHMEPDKLGHWWIVSNEIGRRLQAAWIPYPEDSFESARRTWDFARLTQPPEFDYEHDLPLDYWNPEARVAKLDEFGIDRAVLLADYGSAWPRGVADRLDIIRTNMGAWNRWAVEVRQAGHGRLEPVGHVTLRGGDLTWLEEQLRYLGSNGVKAAMLNYGLVDGRRLSHPDHDRAWAAFVEHGVVPVFHIIDSDGRCSNLPEAWFENDHPFISVLEFPFSNLGPQIAIADLTLNGVFERFPQLTILCIEVTAGWIASLLHGTPGFPLLSQFPINGLGLDLSYQLQPAFVGRHVYDLELLPSEYVRRQVRVTANPMEPIRTYLDSVMEDMVLFGGDYPHSEGLISPLKEVKAILGELPDTQREKFYGGNAAATLGIS